MNASVLKEEIRAGSLVKIDIDQQGADEATRQCLKGWRKAHVWPLIVLRCGSEHVVAKDKTDRIIHFGSTGDPSFHIAHVKLSV